MDRDWATTLFPASYNGVPFWVEAETGEGGRRLVKHKMAGSDDIKIEDFGSEGSGFSITAYTIGDNADTASAALIAALDQGGPGVLVLPADGVKTVYPERWTRQRSRDRMGYFALEITVSVDSTGGGYALGIGMIANAFGAGIAAAAVAFGGAF